MTALFKFLLWLPFVFFIFMYIAGPLLVWRLQRSPAEFHFLRLKDNDVLNTVSPLSAERDKVLRQLGFRFVGAASMAMGNGQTYFSVYRSRDDLLALLIAMKGAGRHLTYVEFIRQSPDESVTIVSNASMGSVFPDSARKRNLRYPDMSDVSELFALAKKIFAKLHDTPALAFTSGKELDQIEQFLKRESEALVERGWYRAEVVEGYRRLTLRGAFAMVWRLLWPMRQLLQRQNQQQAKRLREQVEAVAQ